MEFVQSGDVPRKPPFFCLSLLLQQRALPYSCLYTKEIIVVIYVSLWWQTMQPILEELIARGENSPFYKLLDIKIEEVRDDYARLSIEVAKKHIQFLKTVHGGVVASLADSAAWAVYGSVSLASEFRKSARILGRS